MEAQSHAQHFAAKAQRHAQARLEAAAHVQHLKRAAQMGVFIICFPFALWAFTAVCICMCIRCLPPSQCCLVICLRQVPDCSACAAEEQSPRKVVAQAQEYEAQAQGHAQAQSQLVVHAHNLTAKAHAHANAQVRPTPKVGLPSIHFYILIGLHRSCYYVELPGSDLSMKPLLAGPSSGTGPSGC
jgi:hypothetical protein